MIFGELKGKKVLVTGASSGIGAATAQLFAQQGCYVGVHYFRTKSGGEKTLESMNKTSSGCLLKADMRDKKQTYAMVEEFAEKAGGIDVLVNNAGTLIERNSIETSPEEYFDDIFNTNVKSAFLAAQASKEFSPFGIRVNCVSPGLIETRFHEQFSTPQRRKDVANSTPLGRNGTAQDIANAIIFLSSPAASFITGENLSVNGGLLMRP